MARQSSAALSTLTPILDRRPKPPVELSEVQAQAWKAVVATKPPEWFDSAILPVLVAYCESVEALGLIAASLKGFESDWLADDDGMRRFERLSALRVRESKLLAELATKMRLTQQSRYEPAKASVHARKASGIRPWDLEKAVG